jgi:hypothetical protein
MEGIYWGYKTGASNYRGILLLPTKYNILYNILVSRLTPYVVEIIGDRQCGFRRNSSTTDQIMHSSDTGEKKKNIIRTVHQLFKDFEKAYD